MEKATMLKRFTQVTLSAVIPLCICAVALPQEGGEPAKKGPQWEDQAEYTLVSTAYQEKDPNKKLQLLDEWKQKYPETDFSLDRVRVYMATYQQARQNGKAVETAKELLGVVPGDFSANVTIASFTPFLGKTDAETLTDGGSAAQALLKGIDEHFKASNKPAQVSVQAWDNARKQIETSSQQTLGWVAMQKKDNIEAEERFKKVLGLNPTSGQVSYWLGQVVLGQGNPDKNELAMFSFARAAAYEGPGALPPQGRQQVNDFLKGIYEKFAGTEEGLAEMKELAKTRPLPPADLEIKSASQRKFEAEQLHRKRNPKLYVFIDLKKTLQGSGGDSTWSQLRGKLTPEMRLYVISATPASRPRTINLGSKAGGAVEVALTLENRLRSAVGAGRQVTFEGVAVALTKSPFRLTLNEGKLVQ
jgi:tetratricopeptide (TPR) repeat protein